MPKEAKCFSWIESNLITGTCQKTFPRRSFPWSFSLTCFFLHRYPLLLRRVRRRSKGFVCPDDIQVFLRRRPLRRCQGWSQDKPQGLLHQWAGEDHPSIHSRVGQEGVHWSVWDLREGLGNYFRLWRGGAWCRILKDGEVREGEAKGKIGRNKCAWGSENETLNTRRTNVFSL